MISAEGADSSFQGARVLNQKEKNAQFDVKGAPIGIVRNITGDSSLKKSSLKSKNESKDKPIDSKKDEPQLGLISQASDLNENSQFLHSQKRYDELTVELKEEDMLSL